MKKLNWASFVILCAFITSLPLRAGESFVPLERGLRLASDDLIYNGQVLTSRQADQLAKDGKVNLATLSPKVNDLWSNQDFQLDDQGKIALRDLDVVNYEGGLLSNSGLYRFNAIPVDGNKIYTIHLDKSLHTMLLRKNILRMLGYKIPAMKYVKKLVVQFPNKFVMENFLKREIPEATLGASDRWAMTDLVQENELRVTLKDVAISEPNEFDFYNVSMGIPTQTINSRTLRSLIIPYSILDLGESVNQLSWVGCKVDNKSVILPHFTSNDFATSVDDSIWMINRFNSLSREKIAAAVKEAHFPKEAEVVLIEKIVSRRNALNRCFSVKAKDLPFNSKINFEQSVKEGKILTKSFPDYASRFAYGDAESPLEQLRYYFFAKVQANIIDNLVNKLNTEMIGFDLGEKRTEYFRKQFKEGLDHFVQTGEFLPIKVGAWYSPVVNVKFLLSRDIILGNYLGTDNLVQLADTFGGGAEIGVFAGIEGLGNDLAASAKAGATYVRSYTHLKPVKNLRASLKEPYRNMFVGLLKRSLREKYLSLSELKKYAENSSEEGSKEKDELKKKIEELFVEIDRNLNTGESLIITDRVMPTTTFKLNFNQGLIGAGVGVSAGVTVMKRIHLYKKSAKVLQIYDDSGFVKSIDLNFQVSNYINMVRLSGKMDKGKYTVNSYMVNLSSNFEENENLFSNALGVYNVLKNRDFELLAKNNPPVKLDVNFKDRSMGLSVLFWKMKSLSGKTYYDFKAKDGVEGSYFSLEKDFLTGLNPEAFSKQLVNYYLVKKEIEDVQIAEEGDKNPGESVFGRSHTKKIRFEASIEDNKEFGQKFIALSDVKQGWSMSEKKIRKFMKSVNDKFQYPLFEPDLIDFKKLRLFEVGVHMNLYNRGIQKVLKISLDDINKLEAKYKKSRACHFEDQKINTAYCGDLNWLKSKVKKCQTLLFDNEEMAECTVGVFEKMMEDLDFNDVRNLVGDDNIYVYGTIDGFREKSEVLNDTIYSNSMGKIGSKQWNGPLDVVRDLLGLSGGEFSGGWIREGL
jgi:hypothetical protein